MFVNTFALNPLVDSTMSLKRQRPVRIEYDLLFREGAKQIRRYDSLRKVAVIHFTGLGTARQLRRKERELIDWLLRLGSYIVLPGVRVRRVTGPLRLPLLKSYEIEIDVMDGIVGF